MADTPDPGSWAAVATFVASIVAGIVAGIAGLRRGERRATQGHAEGDPAGLGGGALFVDSRPMASIVEELRKLRLAVERLGKQRAEAEDREDQRRRDTLERQLEALLKRMDKDE